MGSYRQVHGGARDRWFERHRTQRLLRRERCLYPEQVERWRQAAQDANEKPVLTLKEQKELEKLRAQDQREIKALKKELQRKEKAMAEMAALLVLRKKWEAFCSEDAEG